MQRYYLDGPFIIPLGLNNEPFQAHYELALSKRTSDGQITESRKTGMMYRARDGRTRRETFDYPATGASEALIYEPGARQIHFLDSGSRTVISVPLVEGAEAEQGLGRETAQTPVFEGDDLGRRTIEGLECRGYRMVDSGGRVLEYWVSEELQEVLLASSTSPTEESTLRLSDIRRTEPDMSMFEVPENYEEAVEVGRNSATTVMPENVQNGNNDLLNLLIDAAATGNTTALKSVLGTGVDVNERDEAGNSALAYASSGQSPDVVQALLDAGAEVNSVGKDGSTPIIYAAISGNIEIARLLLDAGADVNIRNHAGVSALLIARDRQHDNLIRTFVQAGARD